MRTIACLALLRIAMAPEDPHAEKPNIVIIYVDDLGYGDLGWPA